MDLRLKLYHLLTDFNRRKKWLVFLGFLVPCLVPAYFKAEKAYAATDPDQAAALFTTAELYAVIGFLLAVVVLLYLTLFVSRYKKE